MEKSWVMTEEERLQLLRQRMERKAKQQTSSSGISRAAPPPPLGAAAGGPTTLPAATPYAPDPTDLPQYVGGNSQVALLRELVDKYEASYSAVPYPPQLMAAAHGQMTVMEMIAMLITIIKRMTHFAGSLDVFSRLSENDKATLLRCSMIELCLIRAAYAYDPVHRCWPDTSKPLYRHSPRLQVEDLRRILPAELHAVHLKFNTDLQSMSLDETTYMLLIMVVMLSSERPGLQRPEIISQMQESYLLLLQRYMNWRYSPVQAAKIYPKVLLKLPDLRELSDAHIQTHLQLTQEDIEEFQRQFGNILEGYSAEHHPAEPSWPQFQSEEPSSSMSSSATAPAHPSLSSPSFVEMPAPPRLWLPYPLPLPRHSLPEPQVTIMPPFIDPTHHLLLRPHHPETTTSGNSTPPPPLSSPFKSHPRKPP